MTLLTLEKPVRARRRARKGRRAVGPLTAVRIYRGSHCVGQLLFDADRRLWRRGPDVPADIALKVQVLFARWGGSGGELRGREDGAFYFWEVAEALKSAS